MISSFYFGCRDTYIEVREMGRVSNSSTRAGKSCIWSRASGESSMFLRISASKAGFA